MEFIIITIVGSKNKGIVNRIACSLIPTDRALSAAIAPQRFAMADSRPGVRYTVLAGEGALRACRALAHGRLSSLCTRRARRNRVLNCLVLLTIQHPISMSGRRALPPPAGAAHILLRATANALCSHLAASSFTIVRGRHHTHP